MTRGVVFVGIIPSKAGVPATVGMPTTSKMSYRDKIDCHHAISGTDIASSILVLNAFRP